MDKSVFDRHHIQFDTEAKTQKEAFHVIAHAAYEAGYVKDENAYFEGMCEREKEATTGFQDGIAIPHSKHATCIKPGIFLVKFDTRLHGMRWMVSLYRWHWGLRFQRMAVMCICVS